MSHKSHNPTDRLSVWGKAQQQMPSRNLEMKNVALFSLKPIESKKRRYPHWSQYVMSVVTVCGVVFAVGNLALNRLSDATNSVAMRATGAQDTLVTYSVPTALPETSLMAADVEPALNRFQKNVTDTREFLKTYYQATIRTRQVSKLATHIQTMVRGYGGRMDDISLNKESVHISFVVPKNKFEAFSEELRGLVRPKFIEENISAENLLSQKQVIEKQTNRAEETLFTVQQQRDALVKNHQSLVNNLQNQINSFNRQIKGLRNQYTTTTSTEQQQILSNQIVLVADKQNQAKQALAQENFRYETALRLNDANLSASQDRVDNWYKEDSELLANVETVEASVSLRWISGWEVIRLYVPIYGLAAAVLLGGIAAYWVVYLVRPQKFPE